MFSSQSDGGGKATNSAILSEPTEPDDDGGGKLSVSTPAVIGIPASPVMSASTIEERVSVRVLQSRNRSRKILTEEGRQAYAAQMLATKISDRMFATDRVPMAIIVVSEANELMKSYKLRRNPFYLAEGNVSMGEVADIFNRLHVNNGFDSKDSVFRRPASFLPTSVNPDTLVRKFMPPTRPKGVARRDRPRRTS